MVEGNVYTWNYFEKTFESIFKSLSQLCHGSFWIFGILSVPRTRAKVKNLACAVIIWNFDCNNQSKLYCIESCTVSSSALNHYEKISVDMKYIKKWRTRSTKGKTRQKWWPSQCQRWRLLQWSRGCDGYTTSDVEILTVICTSCSGRRGLTSVGNAAHCMVAIHAISCQQV